MICPRCGTQIPDDSTFCENCGTRLGGGPASMPNQAQNANQMPYQAHNPNQMPYQAQNPNQMPYPNYPQNNPYAAGGRKAGGTGAMKYIILGLAVGFVVLAGAGAMFFLKGRGEGGNSGKSGKAQETAAQIEEAENKDRKTAKKKEETKPAETTAPVSEDGNSGEKVGAGPGALEFLKGKLPGAGKEMETPPETPAVTEPMPAVPAGRMEDVRPEDFNWFFDEEFPLDGMPLTELQDIGGEWKGLVRTTTEVNGVWQTRLMFANAEIQYMGYKVTLLQHVKERYQYPEKDPGQIEEVETADGVTLNWAGDWDEQSGTIYVSSEQTSLRCRIMDFVESDGLQYGLGLIYDDETEIGQIAFVRDAPR